MEILETICTYAETRYMAELTKQIINEMMDLFCARLSVGYLFFTINTTSCHTSNIFLVEQAFKHERQKDTKHLEDNIVV